MSGDENNEFDLDVRNAVRSEVFSTCLFVGNLPPTVDEACLKQFFSAAVGCVRTTKIERNVFTRASCGYGYVDFIDRASTERAVEECNFACFPGHPEQPCFLVLDEVRHVLNNYIDSRASREIAKQCGCLQVQNLVQTMNDRKFYGMFKRNGRILLSRVCTYPNDASKCIGHGYVIYENAIDLGLTMQELAGADGDQQEGRQGIEFREISLEEALKKINLTGLVSNAYDPAYGKTSVARIVISPAQRQECADKEKGLKIPSSMVPSSTIPRLFLIVLSKLVQKW